jgi:transposase
MIPIASGVRVWIATGHTDMRRGMNSLALLVQEAFRRDPHGGDLYVFRGKSGKLIKILWHDGLGMSLYAKRLERGRFLWPSPADGVVTISPAQLGYLLEGSPSDKRERDAPPRLHANVLDGWLASQTRYVVHVKLRCVETRF